MDLLSFVLIISALVRTMELVDPFPLVKDNEISPISGFKSNSSLNFNSRTLPVLSIF